MSETRRFDVVVAGAGTAGAAAAAMLAASGQRVALFDGRALDRSGARWVNGVAAWLFDEAGLDRPQAPELRDAPADFTLLSHDERHRLTIGKGGPLGVDMRLLVQRLQGLATDNGVTVFEKSRIGALSFKGSRPTAVTLLRDEGTLTLEASLFVDATGLSGALRKRVPAINVDCPKVGLEHVCTAAQAVHTITDSAAALAALKRRDGYPGQVLSRSGVEGGWSISNVTVSEDLDTVDFLAGAIAHRDPGAGPRLIAQAAAEPWVGERLFGGSSLIPLRRSYDRLVAPGIALIGDAACQVFPAHGSGIGMGLVAARALADAVGAAADPGDLRTLWPYAVAYQRRWGALCAVYDVMRRVTQRFSGEQVGRLLGSGVIDESGARATLDQRLPSPNLATAVGALRGGVKAPVLTGRFARGLAATPAIHALYKRYPTRPSDLGRWSWAAGKLFRETPDLVRR